MMVEAALLLREELSEAEKDEDYRATLSLERRRSRREEPLLGNLQRIRDKSWSEACLPQATHQ